MISKLSFVQWLHCPALKEDPAALNLDQTAEFAWRSRCTRNSTVVGRG